MSFFIWQTRTGLAIVGCNGGDAKIIKAGYMIVLVECSEAAHT